jgi:hypothetical protein
MDKKILSAIGKSISVLHNERQKHVSGIMSKYGLGVSGCRGSQSSGVKTARNVG